MSILSDSDPARRIADVVPSDVTVFAPTRGIWVGTTGNVTVRTIEGQIATIPNVQGGTLLPVIADQVRAAGTTAANIQRWW